MKIKLLLLIGILLLSGALVPDAAEQGGADKRSGSWTSFVYIARSLGIPILRASLKIENGSFEQRRPICEIQARIDTLNLAFFFRANNRFASVIETDTFNPIRYVKEIDQKGLLTGRKNYVQTLSFDTANRKVVVEQRGQKERKEISIPSNTYDPLSMFARYYLKEPLQPDQDIRMSIYDGVKLRDMVFRSKMERVTTKLYGEIEAVCLESTTSFSAFGDKEGMIRIWYSADGKKTPVSMELELPMGSVRFDLDGIEKS